jgi:hypothetical protein
LVTFFSILTNSIFIHYDGFINFIITDYFAHAINCIVVARPCSIIIIFSAVDIIVVGLIIIIFFIIIIIRSA